MKNLVFLPSNDDGTRYNAVVVLNDECTGMIVGEDIPAICVVEFLQREAL